jgi:hypothetical protein
MKHVKYYMLKNLASGCPRRSTLQLHGVEGRAQYYTALKRYTRHKITLHLLEAFPGAKVFGNGGSYDPDNEFHDKLVGSAQEDLAALSSLLDQYRVRLTRINEPFRYGLRHGGETEVVELTADGLGVVQGQPAILKITTSRRYSEYAPELACIEKVLKEKHYRLFVMRLGSGDCREILREGDRTKSGRLSKRGLPPWRDLVDEGEELMRRGVEIRKGMTKEPRKHDRPEFGPCGTCPFHNYTVELLGEEINCAGG